MGRVRFEQGELIYGFRIGRCLGEGGFGAVYEAEDEFLGRSCAVKKLDPRAGKSWSLALEEARLLAKAHDPSIIHLYRAVEAPDKSAFLSMEKFGESLDRLLKPGVPWNREKSYSVTRQMLRALGSAHSLGVLHRDLKEANLLYDADLNEIRLCDFGIARGLHTPSEAALLGSLHFIAPERFEGEEEDPRSDLYSVGVLLYRFLSGHYPYESFSDDLDHYLLRLKTEEPAFPRGASPEVGRLCLHLIDRNLDVRPRSADEALSLFEQAIAEDAELKVKTGRERSVYIVIASFVLLLCFGLIVLWFSHDASKPAVKAQTDSSNVVERGDLEKKGLSNGDDGQVLKKTGVSNDVEGQVFGKSGSSTGVEDQVFEKAEVSTEVEGRDLKKKGESTEGEGQVLNKMDASTGGEEGFKGEKGTSEPGRKDGKTVQRVRPSRAKGENKEKTQSSEPREGMGQRRKSPFITNEEDQKKGKKKPRPGSTIEDEEFTSPFILPEED